MKNFIEINEHRIRKNVVKEYKPSGETKLILYFSTSRYKVENITFEFKSRDERDEVLEMLDDSL